MCTVEEERTKKPPKVSKTKHLTVANPRSSLFSVVFLPSLPFTLFSFSLPPLYLTLNSHFRLHSRIPPPGLLSSRRIPKRSHLYVIWDH